MNLLVLNTLAKDYKEALRKTFPELVVHAAKSEEEVEDFVKRMDILLTVRISDALLKKASKLQWVHTITTGVDYLINQPSLRKDVLISCSRGIHVPQMSEIALLFMLALNRNLPQFIRNQDKKVWERWPTKLLYRKKVGILGIGAIGEEIARKCKAFGMTVFGVDVMRRNVDAVDYFYGPEDLPTVVPEVDYFIIVVPNIPQTRRLIGAEVLSSLKPSAFLINIGRGEVVDEEALIRLLKTGKIAGAALDTFWAEPLPEDHPFWGMKNVILTPHVGGMSEFCVDQVLSIFEENLRRFLNGERRNLINFIER
ncbi:MAG TPA: D-2-hydroxyacid dehydrogenase [Thermodesulfobacteriota bacterium]|nr:D-2-hydroxyacid dehydrogenase [Thermodesulfobacteriota bacterium]